MHDSLTSKIFQRLGQKHTEVLGIAVNIHSLGTLEWREDKHLLFFLPYVKEPQNKPLKHSRFQTHFMLQFHCNNVIQ